MDRSNKLEKLKSIYQGYLLSELTNAQLELLPLTKNDVAAAENIVIRSLEETEKIIPFLLVWLMDMNWPVAKVLSPYLSKKGAILKNDIIEILKGNDVMWQYWVLVELVDIEDLTLAKLIKDELVKLSSGKSDESVQNEVNKILQRIREE